MALFVHVVERGGFTAAARHVGAPLSTVSRRIAELERSLGVRLLERSTRAVRMTELGGGFYEYCRRGLEEFDSASLMIQDRQQEISGLLRITVPPNLAQRVFVPMVIAFQMRHPNARVALTSTERYVDLLREHVDVAFRIGPHLDSSLTVRTLATYPIYLVASDAYVAGAHAVRSPADMASHRAIVFGTDCAPQTWSLAPLEQLAKMATTTVTVTPFLALNDFSGILSATLAGAGISRVPSILCGEDLASGKLVRVLPEWSPGSDSISAITPGRRNTSRLQRLFLDHCAEHLPPKIAELRVQTFPRTE